MARIDPHDRSISGWITRRRNKREKAAADAAQDAEATRQVEKFQDERRAAMAAERTFDIWMVRREAGQLILECRDIATHEPVFLRFRLEDEGEREELANGIEEVMEYWSEESEVGG
jgi:hypothetical protein